jgi:hypothetical protein
MVMQAARFASVSQKRFRGGRIAPKLINSKLTQLLNRAHHRCFLFPQKNVGPEARLWFQAQLGGGGKIFVNPLFQARFNSCRALIRRLAVTRQLGGGGKIFVNPLFQAGFNSCRALIRRLAVTRQLGGGGKISLSPESRCSFFPVFSVLKQRLGARIQPT